MFCGQPGLSVVAYSYGEDCTLIQLVHVFLFCISILSFSDVLLPLIIGEQGYLSLELLKKNYLCKACF